MNVFRTSCCCLCLPIVALFSSCGKPFKDDNFTAYFGGEVVNPAAPYIVFSNDSGFCDTLKLDKNNRFFKKYDSLAPGLYTFKHEPEYQYVFFDKNDSLMVLINTQDFDNSITFSGRGDSKNNFLMDTYLSNEKDKDSMFTVFDYPVGKFMKSVEKSHKKNCKRYEDKKDEIEWSDEFDIVADAAVNLPYYSKKEIYPLIHKIRTGEDVMAKLPKNYYCFRESIDVNNPALSGYSPFVKYLSHRLGNMAAAKNPGLDADPEMALKTNISKMHIADTLIRNEKIKNTILNNIAFNYLLEDQNMGNNQKFLETYHKYSTDKSQKNEILKIGNAIRLLKPGNKLPAVDLVTADGQTVSSDQLITGKTVIFFWTEKAPTHLLESHKKTLAFLKNHQDYQFIAVNLDADTVQWQKLLGNYKFNGVVEVRAANFEDMRAKWAITKIHRTIILGQDGKIANAFTGLFDSRFEENLK
ncbi:Thioredoxin-like fold domain-containing protein [Flavobacterium longum]|uniref:TlpA family protein disulfide reductase n=1 Tax=Flavobacterium longum TaxID=1299340 RepID=UPI0039E914C7